MLWKGGGGSESDTKCSQRLCLCGFCFRLSTEESAQETGNAILNSDHLIASWDRHLDMQHLGEGEADGGCVAARFVIYGEHSRIKLLAVGLEVVDAACKQTCAKGDKGGAQLFAEGHVGRVGRHEICIGELQILFGQAAPDARRGVVAASTCGEASGNGDETRNLTGIDVAEQSVLRDVSDEICETDIAHILHVAILREGAVTADRGGSTVDRKERLSGGERLV